MGDTYAYTKLEEGLDEFVAALASPVATRALSKLKFMVLAHAWTEFGIWRPDCDKEQAMAWAWEDMDIAFKGYSDSCLTGAVINLWTSMEREHWGEAVKAINRAIIAADQATSKGVARQYLLQYRGRTCRTPEMGFDLPAIAPAWGKRLHEWAAMQGLDPQRTEEKMRLIEEYERLGLINLGTDPPVAEPPKLRLVAGGKEDSE
jgi:hypothetical protein